MDNQSTYLFGQRFKNRLFVGGLPLNTTAKELADFFSIFSPVIEAKVIKDNNQVPKGYGFVTFTNEEAVRHVTDMGTLFLRNKKLNLGPAVKKQITPVETPELVVVNTINMRGEYFLPVTEQCLPLTVPPYYQYPTYTCSPPAGHTMVFENYQQPVIPFSYAHYPAGEQQCAPPPVPSYSYPTPELQIQRQQSACQRRRNVPPRFRPREH